MAITMEELERKAKAYDGALESAKEIVNNKNASSVWKDWLRNTFPELKESKGEKIRKLLIRLFTSNTNEKFDDVSTQEIIAWLEEQGEKLSQQEVTKISDPVKDSAWSEEDEINFQGIMNEIKANKHEAPDYDIPIYYRYICWLESIKQRIGG